MLKHRDPNAHAFMPWVKLAVVLATLLVLGGVVWAVAAPQGCGANAKLSAGGEYCYVAGQAPLILFSFDGSTPITLETRPANLSFLGPSFQDFPASSLTWKDGEGALLLPNRPSLGFEEPGATNATFPGAAVLFLDQSNGNAHVVWSEDGALRFTRSSEALTNRTAIGGWPFHLLAGSDGVRLEGFYNESCPRTVYDPPAYENQTVHLNSVGLGDLEQRGGAPISVTFSGAQATVCAPGMLVIQRVGDVQVRWTAPWSPRHLIPSRG
jgi:hypothetical protein